MLAPIHEIDSDGNGDITSTPAASYPRGALTTLPIRNKIALLCVFLGAAPFRCLIVLLDGDPNSGDGGGHNNPSVAAASKLRSCIPI